MTIWKFPLSVVAHVVVRMPKGARLLSVQMQGEQPCLWALVHEDAPLTRREFVWLVTGHPAASVDPDKYVGTVQMDRGALVFHLFEV